MMDRAAFYEVLRADGSLFGTGLSKKQVTGTEALLDAGAGLSVDHMANVLAQVHHETGGGMYPVKETVFPYSKDQNPSDATVIARLDSAFAKGQLPWVKTQYWRDGAFGRGQIQLTHWDNYEKLGEVIGEPLLSDPSLALDPDVSAKIAVQGMVCGLFTGKALSHYTSSMGFNHAAARTIVNGDTKTVGPEIETKAAVFVAALNAGGWGTVEPIPDAEPHWLVALFGTIMGKAKA